VLGWVNTVRLVGADRVPGTLWVWRCLPSFQPATIRSGTGVAIAMMGNPDHGRHRHTQRGPGTGSAPTTTGVVLHPTPTPDSERRPSEQ